MIPVRTPFFLPLLYPSLTWRMSPEEKVLYLTFDDGPIPDTTEFALDVLRYTSAQATFFMIGDNVRKHPDVFAKVVNEKHAVGNHTFNHINGWKTSSADYLLNIQRCKDELRKQNKATRLFRPPYGRITRSQIASLKDLNIVMWDVLTHDYNGSLSPEKCLKDSINAVRNGSIIVFHDSLKAERNIKYVLPRFIDHFSEKGFLFKSLTE